MPTTSLIDTCLQIFFDPRPWAVPKWSADVCMCMCICTYICMCICICICVWICICMFTSSVKNDSNLLKQHTYFSQTTKNKHTWVRVLSGTTADSSFVTAGTSSAWLWNIIETLYRLASTNKTNLVLVHELDWLFVKWNLIKDCLHDTHEWDVDNDKQSNPKTEIWFAGKRKKTTDMTIIYFAAIFVPIYPFWGSARCNITPHTL